MSRKAKFIFEIAVFVLVTFGAFYAVFSYANSALTKQAFELGRAIAQAEDRR